MASSPNFCVQILSLKVSLGVLSEIISFCGDQLEWVEDNEYSRSYDDINCIQFAKEMVHHFCDVVFQRIVELSFGE